MPLTLEQFLAAEPTLEQLRRELSTAGRHDIRRLRADERALVQMLERRWTLGVAGWMTAGEGAQVAAELTAAADERRLRASATIEEGCIVFEGSRHGRHRLALSTTSPVRARKHWECYLEACPETAGGTER